MHYDYRNPYLKKSKFETNYPSSMSLSCTSLYAPAITSCPRKHYSLNNWYDLKSSNPQLSQKVLYRMQAQYNKLQSLDHKQCGQYQHIQTCLLNNQCKKSPFNKQNLIDTKLLLKKYSFSDSYSPHWTQQSLRNNFYDPKMQRNMSDTLREYKQLRQKMPIGSQKLLSANSLFDKSGGKFTFGQQKFQKGQVSQRKQIVQSLGGKIQSKSNFTESKKQALYQSSERLSKQSSDGTFGYRRTSKQIPNKIIWNSKEFFFVKIQVEDQ